MSMHNFFPKFQIELFIVVLLAIVNRSVDQFWGLILVNLYFEPQHLKHYFTYKGSNNRRVTSLSLCHILPF